MRLATAGTYCMNPRASTRDRVPSAGSLRQFLRALCYFRADARRVGFTVTLLLLSIGLNVLKPWPVALLVDSVLGSRPYPAWLPAGIRDWGPPVQITAIVAASLALHLLHAAVCAGHAYLTINVGLRGLRRVRDDVFGRLQRISLRYHHGSEAGDIIFRAGTDTCAFQILYQQGVLIVISATGTLLFMAVAMARLNAHLTAVALVAVPILLLSIKVLGRSMRMRGVCAQVEDSKVCHMMTQG